jgi:hypothetical protein
MCTVLLPPGVNPIAVNKYISPTIPKGALERGGSSAVGRGRAGRPVKPEAASAVVVLLMMGVKTPETC